MDLYTIYKSKSKDILKMIGIRASSFTRFLGMRHLWYNIFKRRMSLRYYFLHFGRFFHLN